MINLDKLEKLGWDSLSFRAYIVRPELEYVTEDVQTHINGMNLDSQYIKDFFMNIYVTNLDEDEKMQIGSVKGRFFLHMDFTRFGITLYDLGDGISAINPDDIETMTVLKGPAASALYGSRASHGVILITTKKAEKDKVSVEYNGSFTIDSQLAKWDDIQQVYGMGSNGTYSIDAVSNTNKSWGPKADGTNMLKYFDGVERPYLIIPNNTSEFFRPGFTATNTAIVGVNNGKTGMRF